jgi:alkylation response protein AidB-like acyl-CoA dehydrogenase
MDFAFSEEQDEFRAMLRRFLEERWSIGDVRRLAETPSGFDRGVWKQMAEELGLQGLAIAESHGGQGFGFLEVGIALEEMGRQLAGGPFLASAVVAAAAIERAGSVAQREEWLPAIASGATIATLAVLEADGRNGPDGVAATCRRGADGWRVSGRKVAVLDAQNADLLLVAADRRPRSHAQARRGRAARRRRDAAR